MVLKADCFGKRFNATQGILGAGFYRDARFHGADWRPCSFAHGVIDPDADWCADDLNSSPGDERFVPDGVIVQVGEVFFRICRSPVATSTWDRRAIRFFHNPQRVPDLIFERSMMGLMVSGFVAGHFGNLENFISDWLMDREDVGEREIGGLTYTVVKYFDQLTQSTLPNEAFFYAGSAAGEHVGV